MKLFREPSDPNTHGEHLAQLVLMGGFQIDMLAKGGRQVAFQVWCEAVKRAAADRGTILQDGELEWLWGALTTEPRIQRELGAQLLPREDDWKSQEHVPVLNRGQMLGVFLKPFTSFGGPVLSVPPETQPAGMIRLLDTLNMGPGKAASRRFECRDVNATVEIRVGKPGSQEQEAILMKLEPKDVVVKGGTVTASVRSLNHAFTVTSRRLQPHRRSHGGRIYDHIAWRKNNRWISLEDIRREVEAGKWKVVGALRVVR